MTQRIRWNAYALVTVLATALGCNPAPVSYEIPPPVSQPELDTTAAPTAETVVEVAEAIDEMPAPDETTTAFGGTPHAIPGLIEAEHYDDGPAGVAYHDNDPENQGVAYRENTEVDIEERSDASNGHGVGWARGDEWLIYTVEVAQEGAYTVDIPVASNGPGGTFHLEIDDSDVTGPIEVPDTGGWGTLQTVRAESVLLLAGTHTLKLVMDTTGESGATGDIDCMTFALAE
jgi:hypothetical protein